MYVWIFSISSLVCFCFFVCFSFFLFPLFSSLFPIPFQEKNEGEVEVDEEEEEEEEKEKGVFFPFKK